MTEDPIRPTVKVTDNRHFDRTGEKRAEATPRAATSSEPTPPPAAPGRQQPSQRAPDDAIAPSIGEPAEARTGTRAPSDFSEVAAGLSSSFSLLIARLAQETEIYLGLVPYPGKEKPEPDVEASRAMIDMLSMLQEKTRGNLDPEEARMLESLLYTYRLEFVRQFPGGGDR